MHVLAPNSDPCDLGTHPFHRFPALFSPLSDISLERSGVVEIQRNPYLALKGSGIIMGIIDTGIDYLHPAFRHNDNSSRILSIWDQTIQTGTPPEGINFGSEYNKDHINLAIKSDNPLSIVPTQDLDGHGTAIASIAAGSPSLQNSFRGVVTEAEYVVVKLKNAKRNLRQIAFVPDDIVCFQETDIILALRYLFNVSQKLKRPLAICIALGTSQGSHDGSGTISRYLDYLTQLPGIGIAVGGGNEGNNRRHYYKNVTSSPYVQEFEINVSSKDKLFAMEIWSDVPTRLSIQIMSPTGEMTPVIYPQIGNCSKHHFLLEASIVWVNNIIFEEESGDQVIYIRFKDPLEGIWRFYIKNIDEENYSFDAWLPAENQISKETFFPESTPNTTITSPGNASNVLTTASYDAKSGRSLIESSRGYTRKNDVKPDVSAPGLNIPCALPGNRYGQITGTGSAASHSAGIIAMLLEWAILKGNYTTITGHDINRLIIRGAHRDNSLDRYPNTISGYGQIDINGVFQKMTI